MSKIEIYLKGKTNYWSDLNSLQDSKMYAVRIVNLNERAERTEIWDNKFSNEIEWNKIKKWTTFINHRLMKIIINILIMYQILIKVAKWI